MRSEVPRPPEMPPAEPQPRPKKDRTGLYIAIALIVGVIIVGSVVAYVICQLGSRSQLTEPFSPAKSIHCVDYFVVQEKGEILQPQFALMSEDLDFLSTDGTVHLIISDEATNETVYETEFTIEESDFKYYQTLLGKTILAYQWSIQLSDVQKGFSYGKAKLTFTATNGKTYSDTSEYVSIPKYTEEEAKQLFENRYMQFAITVQQTITQGHFSITLVRVGNFTHLKYDTWGDKVTHFRADLQVTSIASEPEYIFESDIVVLDNLGNQYDYEYSGTLDLGEIYPGVTREGYVLFPELNSGASGIAVIITDTEYPEDIVYEFDVNL